MIKKFSNLAGASELSKEEKKNILGASGFRRCCEYDYVNGGRVCILWVSSGQYCP